MLAILPFFSWTTFSMAAAFSRIALATPSHLLSWSGVILSAAFSAVMRCSTVSGLFEVAAAAAGGLPWSVLEGAAVWAEAEPMPNAKVPATVATAIVRPIEDSFMDVSFPMPQEPARGWRGSWGKNGSGGNGVALFEGCKRKTAGLGPAVFCPLQGDYRIWIVKPGVLL